MRWSKATKSMYLPTRVTRGERCEDTQDIKACWHVALRSGLRRQRDQIDAMEAQVDGLGYVKASIHAMVEHPFRVLKRQFGHAKVCIAG
ncbi:hypothetical protein DID99_35750 [Burkholderia sp. Bp8986]|nr:hypothetical protein DID99_35750 [Burkholderia sp. Bp8986]